MKLWFSSCVVSAMLLGIGLPSRAAARAADLDNSRDLNLPTSDMDATRHELDSNPPKTNLDETDLNIPAGDMEKTRRDLDHDPATTQNVSHALEVSPKDFDDTRQELDRQPPSTDSGAKDLQLPPGQMRATRSAVDQPIPGRLLETRDLQVPAPEEAATTDDISRSSRQMRDEARRNNDMTLEATDEGFIVRHPGWEFGMRFGEWIPLGTQNTTLVIDKIPHYYYFDNGYIFVPSTPSQTTVRGKLDSTSEVEVEGFGPLSNHLALGLEWGLAIEKADTIVDGGYFATTTLDGINPLFKIEYRSYTMHLTPELRVSQDIGAVKIFLQAGMGWYSTTQKLDVKIETNNLLGAVGDTNALNITDDSIGYNAGGGVNVRVLPDLTMGVDVRYHEVLGSNVSSIRAIVPTGVLAYVF